MMRLSIKVIAVILLSALAAAPAFSFQIEQEAPQDTARKDVRIILRGGPDVTIERDEEGRIIIDGLDIDDDELTLPGVRRALVIPRPGQRMLAFRGDSILVPELQPGHAARVLERFRTFDGSPDWLDDLRVFSPGLRDGPGIPGLQIFRRENVEAMRELNRLEKDARELARRARTADGAEREQIDRELDDLLAEIFDRRTELRRERVSHLETEIARERELLDERTQNRRQIIDQRKRDLLGERDPLDW